MSRVIVLCCRAVSILFSIFVSCEFVQAQNFPVKVNYFEPADTVRIFRENVISTIHNERDLAVSPDGREIMYTLGLADNSFRAIIQVELDAGGQVVRKGVAPFSGEYQDIEPFYSPDGSRIYFASTRPMFPDDKSKDYNIWYVDKDKSGWSSMPKALDTLINTSKDEYYPSVTSSGDLYFTGSMVDSKGLEDIYVSAFEDGAFVKPVSLDTSVNSKRYEFNACISSDGNTLIFTSYGRPDDLGGGDLYVSVKDINGNWTTARNLGPKINSAQLDYCPFYDQRKGVLYFTSNRHKEFKGKTSYTQLMKANTHFANGLGNIYFIKTSGW